MTASVDSAVPGCELSDTGLPVVAIMAIGLLCLLSGAAALAVFGLRNRRARLGGALVLLLVVGGVLDVAGGGQEAQALPVAAATSEHDCPDGTGSGGSGDGTDTPFTIIQTSVNAGIGPGREATTLSGTITNDGTASPYITEVTVSIDSVEKAPGAAAGLCDGSDYVLQDASMPVRRTLAPGESAGFTGASIGFSEKGTNQDACKNAILHLLYVTS